MNSIRKKRFVNYRHAILALSHPVQRCWVNQAMHVDCKSKSICYFKIWEENLLLGNNIFFNENTKRPAAHEIALKWNKFNIHKFPLQ